jgi:putative drug exporter of the RND superfamily
MSRMARWCFAHRRIVVGFWVVALVAIVGISHSAGTSYNTSFSLPNTGSQDAVNLLSKDFATASGESDQIVIAATGGKTINSPGVKADATKMLTRVEALPTIASVVSPYTPAGAKQISKNGTVAFATVNWKLKSANINKAQATQLVNTAKSADSAHLAISLGGSAISNSEGAGTGPSVLVGVIAALLIMLLTFGGALLASLMPLLTAGIALGLASGVIGLLSHAFSVPSVSVDLAILIGLGVGVDYGLFIISRHRAAVKEGASFEDAAAQAVATSGRTVLFAGITVCIALLGQFALGVSFLYGLSVASAVAVALTMATSLTFLPAMLGFLGPKVLSRRERARLAGGDIGPETSRFWVRWSGIVQSQRVGVAVLSFAIVALIAIPFFSIRLGSSDAGTDPSGTTTRQAYDTLAKAFGPGFNGPLQLVAKTGSGADKQAFTQLVAKLGHEPGVVTVTQPRPSPNGEAALALLYPTTSPQSVQTVNLVSHLRDSVIPAAERGSSLRVLVGGATATNIDFSHVLSKKLPLFIGVVVILAFLLLMAVFRSILIPLVASVMNLLSIGAALGALHAVFTWGWGASILNVGTGPVDAFIPVLMFSVLFGLSMDYEVYLVSRMHEEWLRRRGSLGTQTQRNDDAVRDGQAKSGRIVAAAAAIMILVFGSFILGGNRILAEFGFGLGFSVLVDAFVIRSSLVPALMHLIGPANWAFPRALDRMLPKVDLEGEVLPAVEAE